ncbi:MAG: PIN domain-containing protein [Bacteroidota bacterium]
MSVDHPKQFVDTNILIYAYDDSAGAKGERARGILVGLWQSGLGCLSIQVLQEFFTNATRKIKNPISIDDAAGVVADVAQWRVHSPVTADVLAAIELARRDKLSYWDAAIITSAQRLGCRLLWSEDLPDGACYGDVVVRNPFAHPSLLQEPAADYTPAPVAAGRRGGRRRSRKG